MNKYIDALVNFVKENDDWETKLKKAPYNLKSIKWCNWQPSWCMFVYNLFNSDLTNDIVRGCRGTVIDVSDIENPKIVSAPYTKFFNYSQEEGKDIEDAINWSNAKFQAKIDGILIKTACINYKLNNGDIEKRLYFFTNGSFDLNAPFEDSLVYDEPETRNAETYGDLLEVALKKLDKSTTINYNKESGEFYITGGFSKCIPIGSTLMFELVSPRNKIICEYKETKLYLHGYRDENLVEKDPRIILPKLAPNVNFEYPELLDASNFDDLKKLLETFNGKEKEGCVVVDYSTNGTPRAKIKCDSYLKLKFAQDTSCNSRVLFKAVVFDEYDDLIAAVPTAIPKIEEIKEKINKLAKWFVNEKKLIGSYSKKEWVEYVRNNKKKELFSFYMDMYKNKSESNTFGKKLKFMSCKKQGYDELNSYLEFI